MNATLSYSKSAIVEKFSFVNGKDNVLAWNTTLKGNFTEAKFGEITKMMNPEGENEGSSGMEDGSGMVGSSGMGAVNDSNGMNETDETMSMSVIGELLSSLEMNYQVFDINMALALNSKAFTEAIDELAKTSNPESDNTELMMAEFNKNMTGILEYENGTKIATSEMTMIDGEISMDFIFADKSRVAMDVYLENSMNEFNDVMSNFVEDLNRKINN